MKKKRQRARRADSTPASVIAAALAESDRQSDTVVAKRYGVAPGTIHTWRTRVPTDPELEKLVLEARRKLTPPAWRDAAALALIRLSDETRRRLDAGEPLDLSLVAASKTYGAICVEAGALLGGDPEGEPLPAPPPPPAPKNDDATDASAEVH